MKKDYYIQGDPARGKEIKAAFEKLGYDTSFVQNLSASDVHILFTLPCDYRVHAFHTAHIEADILKRLVSIDPGYTELPLSVDPKFKVHDWVVDGDRVAIIYDLQKNGYVGHDVNRRDFVCRYSDESRLHLWSIADAKDGDVLCTYEGGNPKIVFILRGNPEGNCSVLSYYCYYNIMYPHFEPNAERGCLAPKRENVKPATKEQRDLLFAKMREAGYQWDADKKELLSAVPKFKVGEWLAGIDDEGDVATEKIVSFSHNKVLLVDTDGCHTEYPKTELNGFHLWTIQDAKDGDVLVCYSEVKGNTIEQTGIFKQYVGRHGGCSNTFLAHTGIDWDGNIIINGYMGSTNILPATKEQRDRLFGKMREAGYEWDAEKKELRKIQPHYDIANFYAGMPVLVRADYACRWDYSVFSRITGNEDWKFAVCNGVSFTQCIPFEGNEHLLGTTDMCDKMYINW